MNTNEVADLTGISIRTLHHYDKIGLLRPGRNPENDYREYGDADLDRLQQILLFKECGFPLSQIKMLMERPDFDREKAFELQKKYLLQEKKRIGLMLKTLEQSVKSVRGEIVMSQKDKFKGFDFNENPYEEEARQLWGDQVVDLSSKSIAARTPEERQTMAAEMDDLFAGLAGIRHEDPGSSNVQEAMAAMYDRFNSNFGGHYTPEAFAGVGQLYITDERFTANVDQYGKGLSAFLAKAMAIFAESRKAGTDR